MTPKRIAASETLDEAAGRGLFEAAAKDGISRGDEIVVDLSQTTAIDSRGGAWLAAIADHVFSQKGDFHCDGQQGSVAEFVTLIEPSWRVRPRPGRSQESFLERVGNGVYAATTELREFLNLLVDAIYWTVLAPFEGRGFRWGLWFDEMYEMGVRAVRINCMMNFLLGLIVAMLSAAQVAPFGLSIYVANLIIIAFARELAAIMTAVVVSARTGAAIAAELATMQVQEEIDALRGMGLNVSQFLVAPKVLALIIVMPCLVGLGMISGVLGGAVWGIGVLGFSADNWFHQTLLFTKVSDVAQGMLKALAFAIMIVLVGCHNGLRVKGGSRGVGLMTTRAVVMDIFFMIIIDIVFATIFYYILG